MIRTLRNESKMCSIIADRHLRIIKKYFTEGDGLAAYKILVFLVEHVVQTIRARCLYRVEDCKDTDDFMVLEGGVNGSRDILREYMVLGSQIHIAPICMVVVSGVHIFKEVFYVRGELVLVFDEVPNFSLYRGDAVPSPIVDGGGMEQISVLITLA